MGSHEAQAFLAAVDRERIAAAIRAAEARSRAEIRVHVAHGDIADVQAEAAHAFERLGMTSTRERNGVLIYLAPRRRRFAVIGDQGIHTRCGDAFWRDVAEAMERAFRAGDFTDGIVLAVERAGAQLAEHFPREAGRTDENELPDDASESG